MSSEVNMENNNDNQSSQVLFTIDETIFFDPQGHKLFCRGKDLSPQEFSLNTPASRCFMLLIQKRGKVVTREEFLQHVWIENGAFVSQNTYYQNISILRRTLKKAGIKEDIIITVPHQGLTLALDVSIEKEDNVIDNKTAVYDSYHQEETSIHSPHTEGKKDEFEMKMRGMPRQEKEIITPGLQPHHKIIIAIFIATIIILINNHLFS